MTCFLEGFVRGFDVKQQSAYVDLFQYQRTRTALGSDGSAEGVQHADTQNVG